MALVHREITLNGSYDFTVECHENKTFDLLFYESSFLSCNKIRHVFSVKIKNTEVFH